MADRFALRDGPAGQVQGPGFALQGTGAAAVRAGGLFAQGLGVLFQQGRQGTLGEAGGGGARKLFHGLEIGIEAGTAVAAGPAGHDFAPAGGQVTDFLEEFGGKFTACHSRYHLVLTARVSEQFLRPLYDTRLRSAKLWMASIGKSEKK